MRAYCLDFRITQCQRVDPGGLTDSHQSVSGKPGAVQSTPRLGARAASLRSYCDGSPFASSLYFHGGRRIRRLRDMAYICALETMFKGPPSSVIRKPAPGTVDHHTRAQPALVDGLRPTL